MRVRPLAIATICVCALAGCGSEPEPAAALDASETNSSSAATQQGAAEAVSGGVSVNQGELGSQQSASEGRGAHGNTGGEIAGGMRVPDRPSGNRQQRPTASRGNRGTPAQAGEAGAQLAPPPIPDQLATDMADARYAEFRSMCRDLFALRDEMKPLEYALAVGSATPEQVKQFNELDAAARREHQRLNKYTWNDRWSSDDRRVMAMIMSLHRGT